MAEQARLNIVVDPSQAIRGLDRLKGAMGKLKSAVFSLQSAFGALVGALAVRSLIKTGEMFENIRVKIMNLTKDQSVANQLFQNTSKYATEVAFSFDDLFKATAKLTPILDNSPEQVDKFLRITGDIAAQMGISAEEASTQMIKMLSAGAGAADRFREDGILAMLGFEAGVSYSAEETKKKLIEAFEDPAFVLNGVAKGMAETYTGTLSMIGDKYMALMQSINDGTSGEGGRGGFFAAVTSIAQGYNQFLDNNLEELKGSFAEFGADIGESLIHVVTSGIRMIGGLLDAVNPVIVIAKGFAKLAGDILSRFVTGFNALPTLIKQFGLLGAIFLGPKFILISTVITTLIGMVDDLMAGLAGAMRYLAKLADDAAKALPEDFGGGIAQRIAGSLRSGADDVDPAISGSKQRKLEEFVSQLTGDGGDLEFLGKGVLENFGEYFGSDLFSSDYQGAANEIANNIEQAHQKNLESIQKVSEETEDGVKEVLTETELAVLKVQEGLKKGADRYFAGLGFTVENMADFTENALQGMEDAFVNMALTGKLSFKDMVNSMIADLARLMVQQLIMAPLKSYFQFAGGGVMTDDGPMKLRRYSRGGIADSPQIAMFGEGSQPEAYVPLPDGRSIPVTVDSNGQGGNVININNHVDARGADRDVDFRIRQAMEETSKMTTANIQNLMRRGRFV